VISRLAKGRAATRRATLAWLVIALLAAPGCAHFVILHDSLNAAEHNDLGVAYEAGGDLQGARREYRAALRLDANLERARVNLGNVEGSLGQWASAEACYRRALQTVPDDADALNNLAIALVRRGHSLDEAVRSAERAVELGGARDSLYCSTLEEARAAARRAPTRPR
jgi:tetratricopeptide (TPR) repeat protein